MRTDDKRYAKFEYTDGHSGDHTKNPFRRGDVVFRVTDEAGGDCPEIGVVLQVHDEYELRTDMFGNADASELKLATKEEIVKFRPNLALDMGIGLVVLK
jgi:hypothetical protein